MPPRDLQERTRLFAIAVVKFCRQLPGTDEAQEEGRSTYAGSSSSALRDGMMPKALIFR